MKFIEKVKIQTTNGLGVRRFFIFGRPVFQYIKINKKKKFSLVRKVEAGKDQRVFYLKVNREHHTSYQCVQQWLDIAVELDCFVYFICDNKKMERGILRSCVFSNLNFRFIPSDRKTFKKAIKKILTGFYSKKWRIVAGSMLTPFVHAAKNNIARSYNIDADDIKILLHPESIAKAFAKAEEYAEKNKLDCFNLDMFLSRSFGSHWSFGVVYVRTPTKCMDAIKKNTDWKHNTHLMRKYNTDYILSSNWEYRDDNVDWLFTYLRDTEQLKLETFYIENARVVHMPDRLLDYSGPFLLHWKDGKCRVPLLSFLYNDQLWSTLPIPKELCKIDLHLTDKDFFDYMYTTCWTEMHTIWHKCLDIAKSQGRIDNSTYAKYSAGTKHE